MHMRLGPHQPLLKVIPLPPQRLNHHTQPRSLHFGILLPLRCFLRLLLQSLPLLPALLGHVVGVVQNMLRVAVHPLYPSKSRHPFCLSAPAKSCFHHGDGRLLNTL